MRKPRVTLKLDSGDLAYLHQLVTEDDLLAPVLDQLEAALTQALAADRRARDEERGR